MTNADMELGKEAVVKTVQTLWKLVWMFLKTLEIDLPLNKLTSLV